MRAARIIGVTVAMAILLLSPMFWLVGASFLFLKMAGLIGLVDDPWRAWWTYLTAGARDFSTLFDLIVAALIPTIALVLAGAVAWRIRSMRANRQPPIYGNSEPATPQDMRKGGIGRTRSFF